MKIAIVVVAVMLGIMPAMAQTLPDAPSASRFTLELSPVSLPGNHQTVVGTESGVDLGLTTNLSIGNKNIIAPGQSFQYFAGEFKYLLPYLSNKLNNVSPQLNGLKFMFGLTGSVGVGRDTLSDKQHWGETAGGFVEYSIDKGAHYSLGAQIEYAKFPGLINNTFLVSLDPAIHF